ncbi:MULTISPECIES: CpsD/CapB family tyrosine-protein kinase [Methylomonas]|uniref:Exopolysaccharide biosynthesis protein n=1 Tax=Methylomonas koyamae TaxID=702114 RepID=A0A177NV24_9GAMM|nr:MULTISPECIES: CpsD/CapB family tyrosine-protein kinase [Methylomonas]OAI21805.1 exopolysaccharide biosynthesis protein [Methylomonas koyamae]OHX38132.1 exopolysaccharide biosynthesis protein [Methylomonas sp. LWB]WGS87460.1 CpsD/CapB family tyrosine-protein kinase [Methylomonas sp. UP202]
MNSIENLADKNTANPAAGLPSDKVNIAYTQTKVQKADERLLKQNRIISAFPQGKWLESYRMLRTRCLQQMDAMEWKTVAITSTGSGTGNSLTAANLAISMAMELDRTALLVDANLQNPSQHQLFGFPQGAGLSDYLLNDSELSTMLVNPGIERLVVLPAGKPLFNSTEMLRSPKMVRLVNELKSRYPSRIIIFDMPPILSHDDTLGFSPYVDCVLLVVDEGHTKTEELKHAANLLKGIDLLGSVFNKATDDKLSFEQV